MSNLMIGIAIGLALGFILGLLTIVGWYSGRMKFLHKLIVYRDSYRVYPYTPFNHDFVYLFSFNGGAWFYELQIDLQGKIVSCEKIPVSAEDAYKLRLKADLNL